MSETPFKDQRDKLVKALRDLLAHHAATCKSAWPGVCGDENYARALLAEIEKESSCG